MSKSFNEIRSQITRYLNTYSQRKNAGILKVFVLLNYFVCKKNPPVILKVILLIFQTGFHVNLRRLILLTTNCFFYIEFGKSADMKQ